VKRWGLPFFPSHPICWRHRHGRGVGFAQAVDWWWKLQLGLLTQPTETISISWGKLSPGHPKIVLGLQTSMTEDAISILVVQTNSNSIS
jgi:hypothetical protein